MSLKRFALQTFVLALVIMLCFAAQAWLFTKKTVYVDLNEVYNKFNYSLSMQKKAEKTLATRKNLLDSLKYRIELEYRQLQQQELLKDRQLALQKFELNRKHYLQQAETFEKNNSEMVEQYDKQIWAQINKYMVQYGEENGVGIIVGGSGTGSVMYADKGLDVTNEVIAYINLKHNGN